MMLYFLYNYCTKLEKEEFAGKPAEMAYMLLVLFSSSGLFKNKYFYKKINIDSISLIFPKYKLLVVIGLLLEMMILFEIPIIAVIYIWCQLNKGERLSYWYINMD